VSLLVRLKSSLPQLLFGKSPGSCDAHTPAFCIDKNDSWKFNPVLLHFVGCLSPMKKLSILVDPEASYWMMKLCALVN